MYTSLYVTKTNSSFAGLLLLTLPNLLRVSYITRSIHRPCQNTELFLEKTQLLVDVTVLKVLERFKNYLMKFVFQLVTSATDGFWLFLDILRIEVVLKNSELLVLR